MRKPVLLAATAMLAGVTAAAASESEEDRRQARQEELDRNCEAARQVALQPRREAIYQECINKFRKEEGVCRNEANSYNGYRVSGAPLYYDLPECVEAFDYRKDKDQ
jgi:hypothetical protein